MFVRNKLLLVVLGLIFCIIAFLVYFYVYSLYQTPQKTTPSAPAPSTETISQLTQITNQTEKKGLKIVLSSVENILPDMKTVVFDGERITEINLVAFSKDDISKIDFCKYTYEIYLNGHDKKDYLSCTTKKINKNSILINLKTNIRASESSYLSIYPVGEPKILGIDELRVG